MGNRSLKSLIATSVSLLWLASAGHAACSDDTVMMRGALGEARFAVTVADTMAERSRGLMFVEDMPLMEGMLFVYRQPQSVSFWMRNTLIPLDMIFVGADGVVDNIHAMAEPLNETPIFGGSDIQFVLEVNGGLAERLGLQAGDQMQHPSFGADSVWPCEAN